MKERLLFVGTIEGFVEFLKKELYIYKDCTVEDFVAEQTHLKRSKKALADAEDYSA